VIRRAAVAALLIINVVGTAAFVQRWSPDAYWGSIRIIDAAEANGMRAEKPEGVGVGNISEDVEFGPATLDIVGLSPIQRFVGWSKIPVSRSLGGDHTDDLEGTFRERRLFRQIGEERQLNPTIPHNGLGASVIYDGDRYVDRFVSNERCWVYLLYIDVNSRSLAFHKSPSLQSADYRQNESENADNSRPSGHGPIKSIIPLWLRGIVVFGLMMFGAWVGVWSIVFWDSLGLWRWLLSAIGWGIMIGTIVQGLPVRP
jgi:hypothetical protein